MPDMRFAPPPAMRVADRGGGLNQTSVRTYNERLVMSLLRQFDQLSRMELGQKSGLSAQTVSVIVRALEQDGLILGGQAQRGRVGPPKIPMALNPDGAFAIGVRIGRAGVDLALIDFVGRVRALREHHCEAPSPGQALECLARDIPKLVSEIAPALRARLSGVGVAVPRDLESWPPSQAGDNWAQVNLERRISAIADLPVHIQNDVTAAAGAEIAFGMARTLGDFAYFYVGERIESRLVLNHRVYAGEGGAGPLPGETAPPDHAAELAAAIRALFGFVKVDSIIIDGRLPSGSCEALCTEVAALLAGLQPVSILAGQVGSVAEVVGAAALCFQSRFMVDDVGLASA